MGRIGANSGELQKLLRDVLDRNPNDRISILVTLQRQHFFVPAEKLPAARADLIRALAKGDVSYYERAKKDYQVEEIMKIKKSPQEGLNSYAQERGEST